MNEIETAVHRVLLGIVQQRIPAATTVKNEDRLTVELGLKSLEIAQLVALLELEVGVDPFAQLVPITDIRTVGDLCAAYQKALAEEGDGTSSAVQETV